MTDQLTAPGSTVLYTHHDNEDQFRYGSIELLDKLKMETEWSTVYCSGPDSVLQPGDEILMSARPASYRFKDPMNQTDLRNTSDASIIAFRRNKMLGVSGKKTWLYYWKEEETNTTSWGLVLPEAQSDTRWCVCVAAGELTGVQPGDEVLIARKPASTAYTLKIDGVGLDGVELHNAGEHEPIAIRRNA